MEAVRLHSAGSREPPKTVGRADGQCTLVRAAFEQDEQVQKRRMSWKLMRLPRRQPGGTQGLGSPSREAPRHAPGRLGPQHGGYVSWADRNPSQPQSLNLQPGRTTSLTEDGITRVRNSLWGRRKIPQAASKKDCFFPGLEAWAGGASAEKPAPLPTPVPAASTGRRGALVPSSGDREQSSG